KESASVAIRAKILASKASDFGLSATPELPHVWAVLMEFRLGKADVTLFAGAEGSTSLYFSTGGGIIGAGGQETVRAASRKLLVVVEKLLPAFVPREAPIGVLAGAVSF